MVKQRNRFLVYLFSIISFAIYGIYWLVSTKNEFNSLGAKVPTAWLLIIPIVNFYWFFKYYQAFAVNVKKDNNTALWVILGFLVGFIMPFIIQTELNKIANQDNQETENNQNPQNPSNEQQPQQAQEQDMQKFQPPQNQQQTEQTQQIPQQPIQ